MSEIETIQIKNDESLMYNPENDKKMKNILLLALSTLNTSKEVQQSEYVYKEKIKVRGYGQLEPVPKMLGRELNGGLNLIIILASKATRNKVNFTTKSREGDQEVRSYNNVSALDFFIDQIHKDEFCVNTKFLVIDSENMTEAIRQTVESLRKIRKANSGMELYLDMHGGPRQNQLLVDAILSLLKMDRISLKKAFNVVGGGEGVPIEDVTESLGAFDFVAGMNEFIRYGSGQGIQEYLQRFKSDDADYLRLGTCIGEISDALALCRMGIFETKLDELKAIIDELHEHKKVRDESKKDRSKENFLDIFIKNIEKDYENLLDSKKRTFIEVIKWADQKEFYQQCLAIIEAKTPEYVFEKFIKKADIKITKVIEAEEGALESEIRSEVDIDTFREDIKNYPEESDASCLARVLLYESGKYTTENGKVVIECNREKKGNHKEKKGSRNKQREGYNIA